MEVGSNLLPMGASSSVAIRNAIRSALATASAGDRILVGVSGGTDSLALASGLFLESAEKALQLVAVIIDHGLQENSDEVSNNAKLQLAKIPLTSAIPDSERVPEPRASPSKTVSA